MHYSIFTLSLGNPVEHLSRIFARMAGFFEDPTHRDQLVFDIVHHFWGGRIVVIRPRGSDPGAALRRGVPIGCAILAGAVMDTAPPPAPHPPPPPRPPPPPPPPPHPHPPTPPP